MSKKPVVLMVLDGYGLSFPSVRPEDQQPVRKRFPEQTDIPSSTYP